MALAKLKQAAARVAQCLENPLISAPFPEETIAANTTMTREEFIARVEHEQAIARFKCEQELVRLDTELARLDVGDIDISVARSSKKQRRTRVGTFNARAVLAPLRILSLNLMHIEKTGDALIDAATKGQTELVDILLAFVSPSVNGFAPLINACQNGHLDTARCLLECANDVSLDAALRVAVLNGHADIVRELLSKNASAASAASFHLGYYYDMLTLDVARALLEHARVSDSDIVNFALGDKVDILRLVLAKRPDYVCGLDPLETMISFATCYGTYINVIQTLIPFVATDSWKSIVSIFVKSTDNSTITIRCTILRMFLERFDPSVQHNILLKHMRRYDIKLVREMVRVLLSDTRVHTDTFALTCAYEYQFNDIVRVIVRNMTPSMRARSYQFLQRYIFERKDVEAEKQLMALLT